ncbi:MAG TPA: DNA translocase FtsK [Tepidisphaeraceae bacterium]|jgi:S-DNA-T family DNA segregation ATPase FtsK/SpoIIIE|nr:DNA translocase FtsK [Tepidisphaeraceae bacterium]
MIDRQALSRRITLILTVVGWLFLLLSIGSFHPTDWPAHGVFPYPPIQNLCGRVGALIAYYCFLTLGQGVFPILFFSGICLFLLLAKSSISDLWLRAIGLLVLSIAFAALIHSFAPSSSNGFPEGRGGILGIGAASYLQDHFNTAGSRLILLSALFVGLLMAADDLVLHTPALVNAAIANAKQKTPGVDWNRFTLPKMPSLPSLPKLSVPSRRIEDEDDDGPLKSPVVLKKETGAKAGVQSFEDLESMTYDHDDVPAATDAAFTDPSESHDDMTAPIPSMLTAIPPVEQQIVTRPQAVINNLSPNKGPAPVAAPVTTAIVLAPTPTPPAEAISSEVEVAETDLPSAPQSEIPNPLAPRPDLVVRMASNAKPPAMPPRPSPPPIKELGEYTLPGWEVLEDAEHGYAETQEKFVREKAAALEQALKEFNIDAHVVEIDTGPVITMYELSLAPGIKVAAITQLQNDICRSLSAVSVRIVAPVPGKNTVGIEVPNAQKEKVRFKELMQLAPEASQKMAIPLYLGKDASGVALVTDLCAMPHCLIAGTTGSGKSVCINTIIMSIMYLQRPDQVKLVLVDPKVVEMAPFKDIPHLMCPIVNDTGRAVSVLEWATTKMDERYELLAEAGVRNIQGYNKLTRDELNERFQPASEEEEAKIPKHLPYIVVIIDELADLMMTSGKEVESSIVRLAQKSRAVGIHLVLATQRPQANVVTGLIKANMPSRIAFRVQSRMDSRIVLDQNGAELLLGQGDMLFMPPGANKPIRSQGTFIDDHEIRASVKLVKTLAEAQYEPELVQIKASGNAVAEIDKDEMFDDAVKVVLETKRGSVSLLQRRLNVGYGRAARLIEMMAQTGIVGEYKGTQSREATITLEEWEAMKAAQRRDMDDGMTV